MNTLKFFTTILFAATAITASAQAPGFLTTTTSSLEARGYETYGKIAQTNRLGNTYNKYLKRTDPETGEVQRYLLSSKPITGFELGLGLGAHLYNKNVTFLPTIIGGWHGSHWIVEGEGGIGKGRYMDPESDKYKETYWSVIVRGSLRYKVYSSKKNNQMLEKWFISVGAFAEYDNRRNSTSEVIETADQYTKNEDWVQGSSYALGPELEFGLTDAKHGMRYSLMLYGGVGRDYENKGTITTPMGGLTFRITGVLSKTHKTKLGEQVLR